MEGRPVWEFSQSTGVTGVSYTRPVSQYLGNCTTVLSHQSTFLIFLCLQDETLLTSISLGVIEEAEYTASSRTISFTRSAQFLNAHKLIDTPLLMHVNFCSHSALQASDNKYQQHRIGVGQNITTHSIAIFPLAILYRYTGAKYRYYYYFYFYFIFYFFQFQCGPHRGSKQEVFHE